jgi:hypothetical protein
VKSAAALVEECLGSQEPARLQTTLMLIPDKVCAVAFAALDDARRRSLYALLGGTKATRVREEILLEARRRTTPLVRARILRSFLSYFRAARKSAPAIWIRPKRPR